MKSDGSHLARAAHIDAGLARLSARQAPGQTFTLEAIAAECGCTKSAIHNAEVKALASFHRALRASLALSVEEMAEINSQSI